LIDKINDYEYDMAESITELITKIIHCFDSNLLLIITYDVMPLIPDSLSSPNYLQSALVVTWNNLFLIATQNFVRAAQSYQAPSESSATRDE
jgi:hypothetical protein